MQSKFVAAAIAACISVQHCAYAAETSTEKNVEVEEKSVVLEKETRIFLGKCLFLPPVQGSEKTISENITTRALPPALALSLAKFAVDYTAAAIKVASEEQSVNTISAFPASGWFYKVEKDASFGLNPAYECIQIVSGSYENGNQNLGEKFTQIARNTSQIDQVRKALRLQHPEINVPRLFFETRIEPFLSEAKVAPDVFRLVPNAFFFDQPIDSKPSDAWFGKSIKRSIGITITFSRANTTDTAPFASIAVPFPEVTKGTYLSPAYFAPLATRPISIPALSASEKATIERKQSAIEAEELILNNQKPKSFPPLAHESDEYRKARVEYCNQNKLLFSKVEEQDPLCHSAMNDAKATMDRARERQLADATFNAQLEAYRAKDGVVCEKRTCAVPESYVLPYLASAAVVEVDKPGEFAKFMNKVALAVAPATQTYIDAAINAKNVDPSIAINDAASKKDDYLEQMGLVKLAQDDLNAGGEPAEIKEKKKRLLEAKKSANSKARSAGLPAPFDLASPF
jgi:hypothetical protein